MNADCPTIDFVYPGSVTASENYASEPPLGPVAVISSLPLELRQKVRFLDSTLISDQEILVEVQTRRPDVVAISCTTFNYPNALRLAEAAKLLGSRVILGGIHVTHRRDAILGKMQKEGRPIDFVVSGYGEPTMTPLLRSLCGTSELRETPNLGYLEDGRIIVTDSSYARSGADPLVAPLDFSLVDFSRYSAQFKRIGNLRDVEVAATTYTQRGCAYAGSRKCTFCSIEQINPRRPQELIVQDFITLIAEHGADHIRISDGDFTVSIRHMTRVAEALEQAIEETGKRPSIYCFTRADEVDEQRVRLLERMNARSVFIGYESGSDAMLRTMQKHTTRKQNIDAARLLRKHGIDVVCAGLVLGAEGESEATLNETVSFVHELKKTGSTQSLLATPLIPLPGSPSFNQLLAALAKADPGKHRELDQADSFDIKELIRLWNRYMCHVSLDRIVAVRDEIEALFEIGIRYLDFTARNGEQETS